MADLNLVKELRARTNSGFADCKKALEATNWDLEAAVEWLRENGIAKAAKKAGRIAAEGLVAIAGDDKEAVLVELNSETDFAAKNEKFGKLLSEIAQAVLNSNATSHEEILQAKLASGETIEQACANATATIGEKISFRRSLKVTATEGEVLGRYVHANNLVGAIVKVKGSDAEAARAVAMHLSAMNPEFVLLSDIPAKRLEDIKSQFTEPANFASKPANIQEQIKNGWLNKQLSEIVLVKQPFVMDDGLSVEQYLKNHNCELLAAYRFEVGEGIEKAQSNFAAEVMSIVK
ncbi:elongation factor Ts [Mycoplasmopsis pullorum]|uniref:translation elongation factor Ts n=1 Tax=Mycoplasmopsis pullorum TaxID=48003 RepID=UPI00111AAA21|nr:translation elongation factor Ts [Mycoplasmopsis pullorum]TNK83550.1 elongation factor Ts [Mycoplasmopsis pullorum]TNK92312.1 elongation factor Ts [Mycoplasmopsis pullorum]